MLVIVEDLHWIDPSTDGPIEILVTRVWGQQVSLGVSAHAELTIYRGEKEGVVPWRGGLRERNDVFPQGCVGLGDNGYKAANAIFLADAEEK